MNLQNLSKKIQKLKEEPRMVNPRPARGGRKNLLKKEMMVEQWSKVQGIREESGILRKLGVKNI